MEAIGIQPVEEKGGSNLQLMWLESNPTSNSGQFYHLRLLNSPNTTDLQSFTNQKNRGHTLKKCRMLKQGSNACGFNKF